MQGFAQKNFTASPAIGVNPTQNDLFLQKKAEILAYIKNYY